MRCPYLKKFRPAAFVLLRSFQASPLSEKYRYTRLQPVTSSGFKEAHFVRDEPSNPGLFGRPNTVSWALGMQCLFISKWSLYNGLADTMAPSHLTRKICRVWHSHQNPGRELPCRGSIPGFGTISAGYRCLPACCIL